MTEIDVQDRVWRSLTQKDRSEYMAWLGQAMMERMDVGAKKYNADNELFQGDPLEQAGEEILDLAFYIWYAKKQRSEEVGEGDDVSAGVIAKDRKISLVIGYRVLSMSERQARKLVDEINSVLGYIEHIRQGRASSQ